MLNFNFEKKLIMDYMRDLETCSHNEITDVLRKYATEDYTWEGSFPFMDLTGADETGQVFWGPLKKSLKHLQRRQDVFMAGKADDGKTWVMSMGQFMGLFDDSFLKISPTYKMHHLQYAEFSCIENGKISHTAMWVDLIGFMQEAGLRPLMMETGHYFVYPGPRDHNGLMFGETEMEKTAESMRIVKQMLTDMYTSDATNVDVMQRTWAKDMIWYGPCGVGASYTVERYQKQHQLPFRQNLSDRKSLGREAFFSEGDFVCFYAKLQLSSDGGWLGMAGGSKNSILRGDLDVYYCKDGKISENWCYFDIPYWLYQQGINVIERATGICNPFN